MQPGNGRDPSRAIVGDGVRNGDADGSIPPRAARVAARADGSLMIHSEGGENAARMGPGGCESLARAIAAPRT